MTTGLSRRRRTLIGASSASPRTAPPPPPPPASAPQNTVPPAITFAASNVVGNQISMTTGTWTGATSYTYRYLRDGVYIAAASASATYILAVADVGHTIRGEVTALNTGNQTSVLTSNATVCQPGASSPTYTVLPVITGTALVGNTLTCSTGTWVADASAPTSFTYQFRRDGVAIAAASAAATYIQASEDLGRTIDCVVRASNATFTTVAPSSNSVVTTGYATLLTVPQISGANVVGQTLTCSTGTWANDLAQPTSYLYAWTRDGTVITSYVADPTYIQVTADVGHTIKAIVTVNNAYNLGVSTPTSNSIVTQAATAVTVEKAQGRTATSLSNQNTTYLPGNAVDGNTTTRWASSFADNQWWQVDLGAARLVSSIEIEWELAYSPTYKIQTSTDGTAFTDRASVTISASGLQATSFTEVSARYVRVLCLTRTPVNGTVYGASFWECRVYGAADNDPPPPPVATAPTNTTQPSVSGSTAVGSVLTCSTGSWVADATAPTSYSYRFRRDGVYITSASATNTYPTVSADAGHLIDCEVVATNAAALSTTVLSLNKITVAGGSPPTLGALLVKDVTSYASGKPLAGQGIANGGYTAFAASEAQPAGNWQGDWMFNPRFSTANVFRSGVARYLQPAAGIYEITGRNTTLCKVEATDLQGWIRYDDGTWIRVVHRPNLAPPYSNLYPEDWGTAAPGNGAIPVTTSQSPTGTALCLLGTLSGPNNRTTTNGLHYLWHIWSGFGDAQGTGRPNNTISGVAAFVRMRLDPATYDPAAKYLGYCGCDAYNSSSRWQSDAGIGRLKRIDRDWRLYTMCNTVTTGTLPTPTGMASTSEIR